MGKTGKSRTIPSPCWAPPPMVLRKPRGVLGSTRRFSRFPQRRENRRSIGGLPLHMLTASLGPVFQRLPPDALVIGCGVRGSRVTDLHSRAPRLATAGPRCPGSIQGRAPAVHASTGGRRMDWNAFRALQANGRMGFRPGLSAWCLNDRERLVRSPSRAQPLRFQAPGRCESGSHCSRWPWSGP